MSSPASLPRRLAILVVDDDQDGADTLGAILREFGHDVRTACTATTAVLEAESFVPDALILDIGIPGTDGYCLARQLCEILCEMLGRHPLLIAITGYGNLDDRSRAEGFDHHFLKPADPAELAAVLAAHAHGAGRATHRPAPEDSSDESHAAAQAGCLRCLCEGQAPRRGPDPGHGSPMPSARSGATGPDGRRPGDRAS